MNFFGLISFDFLDAIILNQHNIIKFHFIQKTINLQYIFNIFQQNKHIYLRFYEVLWNVHFCLKFTRIKKIYICVYL